MKNVNNNNINNEYKYQCVKCGNENYDMDTISTAGGFLSKMFDVQNKKFTAVSCSRCGYTEFYKGKVSTIGNIFDFFTG